jgi:hypothetical protein
MKVKAAVAHKAGAQRVAAELGLMLLAPDTSPPTPASKARQATGSSAKARASTWMPHNHR